MNRSKKSSELRELEHLAQRKGLNRRDFLARAAALGLLPVAAQIWAGSASAQTPVRGGVLRMGLDGGDTTDSMDPHAYIGTPHPSQVFRCAFDFLTIIRPDGSAAPQLAESWELNDDATVWRFNLRRGVTFHDGRPFTAEDVIYSVGYIAQEVSIAGPAKVLMQSVVSIEAEDPHTVVMTLDASNFDFATLIGHQGFAVVPKDTTDFTNPVGTGPYQIVSFEPGVRARLVRYDDFYSDDEGFFDEIEVINIADAATRTNALRNGDVDVIYRPDVATAQRLASQSGIDLVLAEGGQHYTTPMRVGSGALADNDVRLAIKYGIRRQEFVDRVLGGFGYVGNDTPIGRGYAYYNAEIEQREYDPERARFHFDRAGITASDLPVLSTSDGAFSGAVNAAQLIQASMSEAGIGIDIERVAADGYWSDIWQVVPWCFCYWNGSPVIGQQLSYYTGGHSYNDTAFDSGRFNQLVTEAQVERDDALRAEMYGEAQQILHDEGGTAVIGFSSFVHAASSDLGHGQVGGLIPADDHQLGRRWWWNRT